MVRINHSNLKLSISLDTAQLQQECSVHSASSGGVNCMYQFLLNIKKLRQSTNDLHIIFYALANLNQFAGILTICTLNNFKALKH